MSRGDLFEHHPWEASLSLASTYHDQNGTGSQLLMWWWYISIWKRHIMNVCRTEGSDWDEGMLRPLEMFMYLCTPDIVPFYKRYRDPRPSWSLLRAWLTSLHHSLSCTSHISYSSGTLRNEEKHLHRMYRPSYNNPTSIVSFLPFWNNSLNLLYNTISIEKNLCDADVFIMWELQPLFYLMIIYMDTISRL